MLESLEHTPEGKVTVYALASGRRYIRLPDSAATLLATGQFTGTPPLAAATVAAAGSPLGDPVAASTARRRRARTPERA